MDATGPAFLITEDDLTRFYRAVYRAQPLGFFAGHHGVLEHTAWLHVAIHQLEEAEDASRRAIDGDLVQLDRLRTILARAPRWQALSEESEMSRPATMAPAFVQPREPFAVVTAGLLLDRLSAGAGEAWAERAAGYYVARVASVNRALVAADRLLRRQATAAEFAAVVHAANPLEMPTDRSGAGPTEHAGHSAPAAPAAAEMISPAVDPVAAELRRSFAVLLDTGRRHRDLPIPALLLRIADAVTTLPAHAGGVGGRELPLAALASAWNEILPRWTALPPQTARPHPHPVPPEPGHDPSDRCVPGQPQFGGQWEIARLRATEVDEHCPPAEALNKASGKIYGKAGAELIKAQNEWVEAKQCFKDPGDEKCLREEDRGYNKCTQERDDGYNKCTATRDEGYNRCTREEDHGYRKCCKWWPCSWACKAWVWIKKVVCVAWEWVKHIVCVAWVWVKHIVCVVWTWIKKIVCVLWVYIKATVCAFGHLAKAVVHAAVGIGGIVLGAALGTAGGWIGKLCDLVGAKGDTRTTSSLKVVGIHVAVLHTGKVLIFAYDEGVYPVSPDDPADFTAIADSERALCAVWDPQAGTASYAKLRRNLFCSHHSFAEDGRLFVAGGQFPLPGLPKSLIPPKLLAPGADKDVHVFDPVSESWKRFGDMAKGRWYPTCVTLPDGNVFIASGTNGYATEPGLGRGIQDTWQISVPRTGGVVASAPFGFHLYHLYPFLHVIRSGEVFIHFKRTTILFNPQSHALSRIAAGSAGTSPGETRHPFSRTGPGPGTCVLLPLIPIRDRETGRVQYPAARILILGGGGAEKEPEPAVPGEKYELNSYTPATNTAEILDFGADRLEWRFTREPMHRGRVMPDSILLPTGKVLVVGGGGTGQSGGLLAHFTSSDVDGRPNKGATDPVLAPELFDPQTETWERLCPKPLARLYHTTAVLLPDARVLVAGHDGALNMSPYDTSRYELEIFSPPYLFGPDGLPAVRPAIVAAPASVRYGEAFEIETAEPSAIASVALIRQSSTTHQINSDQRYVGLAIRGGRPGRLSVDAPPDGSIAPPGQYMLFLVNRSGVPSVARWVRVGAR